MTPFGKSCRLGFVSIRYSQSVKSKESYSTTSSRLPAGQRRKRFQGLIRTYNCLSIGLTSWLSFKRGQLVISTSSSSSSSPPPRRWLFDTEWSKNTDDLMVSTQAQARRKRYTAKKEPLPKLMESPTRATKCQKKKWLLERKKKKSSLPPWGESSTMDHAVIVEGWSLGKKGAGTKWCSLQTSLRLSWKACLPALWKGFFSGRIMSRAPKTTQSGNATWCCLFFFSSQFCLITRDSYHVCHCCIDNRNHRDIDLGWSVSLLWSTSYSSANHPLKQSIFPLSLSSVSAIEINMSTSYGGSDVAVCGLAVQDAVSTPPNGSDCQMIDHCAIQSSQCI